MTNTDIINRLLDLRSSIKKQIDEVDSILREATNLEKRQKGFNNGVLDVKEEG